MYPINKQREGPSDATDRSIASDKPNQDYGSRKNRVETLSGRTADMAKTKKSIDVFNSASYYDLPGCELGEEYTSINTFTAFL